MVVSCFAVSLYLLQAGQTNIVAFDKVLLPLAAALGLALIVERVVEFLKNIVDMVPTTSVATVVDRPVVSDKEIEKLQQFFDGAESPEQQDCREEHPMETIIVQDATDPDDGTTLRAFVIQSVAVVVGILAARVSGVQLFHALGVGGMSEAADYLLTGLFIGGGSGPAHVLIRFITERRVSVPAETQRAEAPVVPVGASAAEDTPAVVVGANQRLAAAVFAGAPAAETDGWLDIKYAGGVDRERLESVHRRSGNPNLVVFHHTAMPLKSTFEDVVRVIKDRKDSKGNNWITGYHCVVTADGGIHPFCRWDRYGNHAQGFNIRSLGVTLNGNFDTNPKDPWANADGRYGASRPTEAQLDSAARVVALWTHLYPEIPMVFDRKEEGIIPHKNVAKKSCPGNMFPYLQFEKLVRHYHDLWLNSEGCRARIQSYKLRPYLYVDPVRIPDSRWKALALKPAVAAPLSMANLNPGVTPGKPTGN